MFFLKRTARYPQFPSLRVAFEVGTGLSRKTIMKPLTCLTLLANRLFRTNGTSIMRGILGTVLEAYEARETFSAWEG